MNWSSAIFLSGAHCWEFWLRDVRSQREEMGRDQVPPQKEKGAKYVGYFQACKNDWEGDPR